MKNNDNFKNIEKRNSLNNSYVFLLALLVCNMQIFASSNELTLINSRKDLEALKQDFKKDMESKMGVRLHCEVQLTDFKQDTNTATCTMYGWYEILVGNYSHDGVSIEREYSTLSKKEVKISKSQYDRLNWYGCTVS